MNVWWIYALLSAVFAALTAILAKIGVSSINSDLATAVRTVVILIIAWGITIARGSVSGLTLLSKRTLFFLMLSGVATGLSWLCYFKALQLGRVNQVAPVDKLSVAMAILLAALFLKEGIDWKTGLGAGLIITGTIVLIL